MPPLQHNLGRTWRAEGAGFPEPGARCSLLAPRPGCAYGSAVPATAAAAKPLRFGDCSAGSPQPL